MSDWVLRDEILVASHRWPLILAFILAGSLLGWAAAMLWPAPYQASAEMSVSLDPYRFGDDSYVPAFANTEFRNPDDYKHWQMSQLSVLAFSDEYVEETLNRLKGLDPAWETVDVPRLRSMLSVYWRNAGRWRLVARVEDPRLAAQLVEAWRQVILEKSNQAVARSQQIYLLDLEQQAIQAEQLETRLQAEDLLKVQAALSSWLEKVAGSPQGEVLGTAERLPLSALAASAAGLDPGWQGLFAEMPPPGASLQEYLPWVEQLVMASEQKAEMLDARLEVLQEEQSRVEDEWQQALQDGRGLSATLSVGVLQDSPPDVSQPRPAGSAVLVGGLAGFLAWGLFELARISAGRRT